MNITDNEVLSFVCVRVFLCLRESLPSRFVPSMIFEPGRLRAGQTPSIDDAAAPHDLACLLVFSSELRRGQASRSTNVASQIET